MSGLVHLVRFQENGGMVVLQRASSQAVLAEASVLSECAHCAAIAIKPSKLMACARHLADEMRIARKRAGILVLKTVAERLTAWPVVASCTGHMAPCGRRNWREQRRAAS